MTTVCEAAEVDWLEEGEGERSGRPRVRQECCDVGDLHGRRDAKALRRRGRGGASARREWSVRGTWQRRDSQNGEGG